MAVATPSVIRAQSLSAPAPADTRVEIIENDNRSGPRLGVAYILGGSVAAERLQRHIAVTTLFGWQIEHGFPTGLPNLALTTELVGLVGGVEQGVVLPSVSWMLGIRKANGWEGAVGPTVTGAGVQLAIAAGVTHSFGELNVPVNLAVAPGHRGASISLTTGFNLRR